MKDNVKLNLNQIGVGKLIVGDMDLSKYTRRVRIETCVGELTKIEIEISAGIEIECPAEVHAVLGKVNAESDGLIDATNLDSSAIERVKQPL